MLLNASDALGRRCLIIGCSQKKNVSVGSVSAIERYDGPSFRVLRKFLREEPAAKSHLHVLVLSAKFGLINGQEQIGVYDQRMTRQRAFELQEEVKKRILDLILPYDYDEIFLSMGKTYLLALENLSQIVGPETKVRTASGGSGRKLTELKSWLRGQELPGPEFAPEPQLIKARITPQTVTLRGVTIKMTTSEAITQIQKGVQEDPRLARKVQVWYVNVAGDKIGPKWATAQLFGVPVSGFSADEARRVLRRLGLNCYRV